MARSIIILAFAHDPQSELPHLEDESRQLCRLFRRLHDQDLIDLRYYPNTSFEDLAQDLKSLRSRVLLVHYGGHASGDSLQLNSQPFFLKSIAPLMVKFWKPALVFLNGCSTFGMAEDLVREGVDGVIATERAVGDKSARDFAINFYESLVEHRSVSEAFAVASALYKANGDSDPIKRQPGSRHLGTAAQVEKGRKAGIPWKLYRGSSDRLLLKKRFFKRSSRFRIQMVIPLALACLAILWIFPDSTSVNSHFLQPPIFHPTTDSIKKAVSPKEIRIEIVDQSGREIDLGAKAGFFLHFGKKKIPLGNGWIEADQLRQNGNGSSLRFYLSRDNTILSSPDSSYRLPDSRTVQLRVDRVDLEILEPFGQAPPYPIPDFVGFIGDSGDSLQVPLPPGISLPYMIEVLLPYGFAPGKGIRYWLPAGFVNQNPDTIYAPCPIIDSEFSLPCQISILKSDSG